MRILVCLIVLSAALSGCASLGERPVPLTREEIVAMANAGASAEAIIARLRETGTVLLLSGSGIAKLGEAGVPPAVLDHLQRVQIEEIRRREAFAAMHGWGMGFGPFSRCPWPTLPRRIGGAITCW